MVFIPSSSRAEKMEGTHKPPALLLLANRNDLHAVDLPVRQEISSRVRVRRRHELHADAVARLVVTEGTRACNRAGEEVGGVLHKGRLATQVRHAASAHLTRVAILGEGSGWHCRERT